MVVADREVAGARSACEPVGVADGAEVEFAVADGVMQRGPLRSCWNVAFERVAPVRAFASFRGAAQPGGPVVVRDYR